MNPKAALLLTFGFAAGCKSKAPDALVQNFSDDFEREELGDNWQSASRAFSLVNGALQAKGARNKPLWLKKRLPSDLAVEISAWSESDAGDLKIELFGDGRSFDADGGAYLSTGYVFVMGGWNNSKSMIARRDEHGQEGADLVQRSDVRVEKGKRYRWRVTRVGDLITWFVDDMDTPFLEFRDPSPMQGEGHDHLAIGNWEAENWFDDLRVQPLAPPE